jgi:hypothetical protein
MLRRRQKHERFDGFETTTKDSENLTRKKE